MPLIDPQQTSVDLSKSVPGGWQLIGFSEPRSDGVNTFRVPQPVTEIRFSTPGPRYVQFDYRLFSPKADVNAKVTLDGQPLGSFTFPAGKFVTVSPAGFVGAGLHVLRFEQKCAVSCQMVQYQPSFKLVAAPLAAENVALGATRWLLDAPASVFQAPSLSSLEFDGRNFFRTLGSTQAVVLKLPPGFRATALSYQSISNTGDYTLEWRTPDGQRLPAQLTHPPVDKPQRMVDGLPLLSKSFADQNLPLLAQTGLQQLQVQVKCQGSETACLPIRLYRTQLISLKVVPGLPGLRVGEQFGVGSLALGLLALLALLLRPARARR